MDITHSTGPPLQFRTFLSSLGTEDAVALIATGHASGRDVCKRETRVIERTGRAGLRLGIAHHLGWAVAVTASADHQVVDRRRIELVESGMPTAPIHHEGGAHRLHRSGEPLDDIALAALVADVRASVTRTASAELAELATVLPEPIVSISLRAWPADFPEDIAVQRRVPYESQADSIMYRQVLDELARARGWEVDLFDAKDVEEEATRILGARAAEVLHGSRATFGPPWSKDHRIALAATVVAHAPVTRRPKAL